MTQRKLPIAMLCLAIAVVGTCAYFFVCLGWPTVNDNKHDLWTAAHGFLTGLDYIGDDEDFSYFKTDWSYSPQYKRQIDMTNLPEHFLIGEGTPYRVNPHMVPRYNPQLDTGDTGSEAEDSN